MQPSVTTSSALALANNLPLRSSKPSPELRPHPSAIQLYSAIFDAQSRVASHIPCISGFARIRWLSLRFFTVAEIRLSGSVGYNFSCTGRDEARR